MSDQAYTERIAELEKVLAEAQQARERAEQLAGAAIEGKATAERHVVKMCAERDTLLGLLREALSVLNAVSGENIIVNSRLELTAAARVAKLAWERITAVLPKEGE